MRKFGKTVFLVILAGCSSQPSTKNNLLVEQRYVPLVDFQRIGEYFSEEEVPGSRIYFRTDPDQREGYYWIVDRDEIASAINPTEILLSVQIPGSPQIERYSYFINSTQTNGSEYWIGITGDDWPGPRFRPVAWQLSFLDEDGTLSMTSESFLWTTPTGTEIED